jgi:hypothetical protein
MKNIFILGLCSLILISCSSPKKKITQSKDWKKDSDELFLSYMNEQGAIRPEEASTLGLSKFDSKISTPSKKYDEEFYAFSYKWKMKLEQLLETEKNEKLKTDITILLKTINLSMKEFEVKRDIGYVPFSSPVKYIQSRLRDVQKDKGMARFRGYVRGQGNQLPLIDGTTAYMLSKMDMLAQKKKRGAWPKRIEIENYLKHTDRDLALIESMLRNWKGDEWQRDFAELKNQHNEFSQFLKKKVLPHTNDSSIMSEAFYGLLLNKNDVYLTPKEVIKTGRAEYKKTFTAFKKLARNIALIRHLKRNDPFDVIHIIRKKKFTADDKVLKAYNQARIKNIKIIKKNNLLTIARKPVFATRIASKEESSWMTSSSYIPSSVNNNGKKMAEFVVLRSSPDINSSDLTFVDAVRSIVSHEIMPGHALQFQIAGSEWPTQIRKAFANKRTNTEGWGVYAEELMYSYMSDEEKLISLQRRLLALARFYLDAEYQLGKVSKKKIEDIIVDDLGFSKKFYDEELYILDISPGSGSVYYYGFLELQKSKSKLQTELKNSFDEKCFNDTILNQGIVPSYILSAHLEKGLKCESH